MRDKRKTCPDAGTPGQAAGWENFSRYSNPTNNFTTTPAKGQVRLSGFLRPGRENALPLRDLCRLTGMDGRQVRLIIQRERLRGVPVLSDNRRGYYLPGDEREVTEFVKSMRHRAGEIEKAADNVEAAAASYAIEGGFYGG